MTPAADERWLSLIDSGIYARLKSAPLRVYGVLVFWIAPGKGLHIEVQTIADTAGLCAKRTRDAIETLYREGLIIRVKTRPREYMIHLPPAIVDKLSRPCSTT